MMKSIKELYKHHSGKVTDKWSLYLEEWDRIFEPYREKVVDLLEIGIQNGGSLEVWSEAFPKADRIVGCDIEEKCRNLTFADGRIAVIVGDANLTETRKMILKESPTFDMIIDDGSHVSSDVIKTFALYFPLLKEGGVYIIEDLHTSYWQSYEGGLFYPSSSISFLKKLVDNVNFEHWQTQESKRTLWSDFLQILGAEFDEQALAQIHSIEFLNSLCIIKKQPQNSNLLGERIITGTEAIVDRTVIDSRNQSIQDINPALDPEVHRNEETTMVTGPETEEAVRELSNRIGVLNKEIAQLKLAVENKQNEIDDYTSSTSWKITKPLRQISDLFQKRA